MKRKRLRFGRGFRVALGNRRSQAAEMVLKIENTAAGEAELGAAAQDVRGVVLD